MRRTSRVPGPQLAALVLALSTGAAVAGASQLTPVPAATLRAIAIAEDERRYADGELKRHLADPAPAVRARAALAVGRLQDSTTVGDLLPLLGDAAPEVRREAAFALGQIGHKSARESLEARLADQDSETAELAIEALGKLQDRASTPRIAALLADRSPRRRAEAAVALWRLADSTAVRALLDRRSEPDPEVRWRVLYALEKIAAPNLIVLPVALFQDDPNTQVRAQAVRTLGRQKSPRSVAYLLQALDDQEVAVVVNAIRGLQLAADSTCAPCLHSVARRLGNSMPYVRSTAAAFLAERAPWISADTVSRNRTLDSLARHFKDPDPATRGACARAWLARRGESGFRRVEEVFADSSVYARVGAIEGLRTLGPSRQFATLLEERLAPGRHLLERMTAAEVLGARRDPRAAELLRAGLADTSALFVAACAGALGEMRDTLAVPALTRAFTRWAPAADADARNALLDALTALAGSGVSDSLGRAHPAPKASAGSRPDDFAQPSPVRGAILHTARGDIEWAFYANEATQTVKNFVSLAARGYYDGSAFHRVVPNFVIQDGDRTGTGSGGPGYTIRCEYNRLRYEPGMVGMALSGKDTGGSQWFITHSPQPHLNGRYTIFARVVRGMDVVHRITQGDRILRVELVR